MAAAHIFASSKELAFKLGEYRNERIDLANRVYNIESSLYHIVARREKELLLFETDYNQIDIANIHSVKSNKASLQFEDGHNCYSFNYSKSTLFRKVFGGVGSVQSLQATALV